MMDAKRIEEIRKRAEAATAGPWAFEYDGDSSRSYSIEGDFGKKIVSEKVYRTEDAIFLTYSREDIPALLAEVERLRAIIADFADYGTHHDTNPTIGGVIKRRDDVAGWVAYMRSMDKDVRRRAKEALGE